MFAAIREVSDVYAAPGARFYLVIARDGDVRPHWQGAAFGTVEAVKTSPEACGLEWTDPHDECACDVIAIAEWDEPR